MFALQSHGGFVRERFPVFNALSLIKNNVVPGLKLKKVIVNAHSLVRND